MIITRPFHFSLLVAVLVLSAHAKTTPDTLWAFRDSIIDDLTLSPQVIFSSTPNDSLPERLPGIDETATERYKVSSTGDDVHGEYIDLNYQLTNGYAGCRIEWIGLTRAWDVNEYDSMSFIHQGPLPGHKVELYWACHRNGFPDTWQLFCEFSSSTTWQKECFQFPANFIKDSLFELRVLIHQDGSIVDQPGSPGNLKIDDIGFIKGPQLLTHPITPAPLFPANHAALAAPSEITLSWKASPTATSYLIQVQQFSEFDGFVAVLDSIVTDTLLRAILPLPGQTAIYNWRVMANNAAGTSSWTDYLEFSVDMNSTQQRQPDRYPPANLSTSLLAGTTSITAAIPAPFTTGTLTLHSASGRKIARYTLSGRGSHTVTTADVPAGVYFVQLNTGGKTTAATTLRVKQ